MPSRDWSFSTSCYNILDIQLLWTNSTLDFYSIEVGDSTATVEVYAEFSYKSSETVESNPEMVSSNGAPYDFTLVLKDGYWLVTNVEFFDESTDPLKTGEMDVEELVQSRVYVAPEETTVIDLSKDLELDQNASNYVFWELDTSKVASYAIQYANNYNPNFKSYSADCQNFASQCIWFGLGGNNTKTSIDGKYWPMVDLGSSNSRSWYQTSTGSTPTNWSWTSCDEFGDYIQAGGSNYRGPTGVIYSGIVRARVGDLIQYSSGNNDYEHVYIVTGVTGTWGSRTASDITVCAHTQNRNQVKLSALYSSNYTYRTIHVTGGWYDNPGSIMSS